MLVKTVEQQQPLHRCCYAATASRFLQQKAWLCGSRRNTAMLQLPGSKASPARQQLCCNQCIPCSVCFQWHYCTRQRMPAHIASLVLCTGWLQVGNDCSCVAIARKRGIDVLMNKESTRETPAMVCFGDKMRFIGEACCCLGGWRAQLAWLAGQRSKGATAGQ
jgi:hypothetical protein